MNGKFLWLYVTHHYDIITKILLCLLLPGMQGIEVTQHIQYMQLYAYTNRMAAVWVVHGLVINPLNATIKTKLRR